MTLNHYQTTIFRILLDLRRIFISAPDKNHPPQRLLYSGSLASYVPVRNASAHDLYHQPPLVIMAQFPLFSSLSRSSVVKNISLELAIESLRCEDLNSAIVSLYFSSSLSTVKFLYKTTELSPPSDWISNKASCGVAVSL